MMPAISKMVVLPNHSRKFIRQISARTEILMEKKSIASSMMPLCISSWFTGPTLENRVKNSMENAEAMIRLGM